VSNKVPVLKDAQNRVCYFNHWTELLNKSFQVMNIV